VVPQSAYVAPSGCLEYNTGCHAVRGLCDRSVEHGSVLWSAGQPGRGQRSVDTQYAVYVEQGRRWACSVPGGSEAKANVVKTVNAGVAAVLGCAEDCGEADS
jgi:hypothetical protein